MGPNLLSADAGAMLEVQLDDATATTHLSAWMAHVRSATAALGWPAPSVQVDRDAASARCFFTAPVDQLMTATEVAEQAWAAAEELGAMPLEQLRARARYAANPQLVALRNAAVARRVLFTFDDESAALGSGAGVQVWPLDALPAVAAIDWGAVHDIPVALVTGSNGKTTTTRLIAAMLRAAGRVAGLSSTDGVVIDDETVEAGDFSGPAGARLVVRDPRVQVAVLETARGGILRRGLGVSRAAVAIVTNIAADHLGMYGIHDLTALAHVKLVTARALDADGVLVLNADDATLRAAAVDLRMPICWFSLRADDPFVLAHIAAGGRAALLREDELVLFQDGTAIELGSASTLPMAHAGAARHNIANALGAAAVATVLGVSVCTIRTALATFGTHAGDNVGRLDIRRYRGITAIIDYAHNPAGILALCDVARSLPAMRRLLVLGQAGDREDAALAELARAAWSALPFDRVIVKRMETLRRGRAVGATEAVLLAALRAAGADERQLELADSELLAVQRAFIWAAPGDLLVLPVHAERAAVLQWLEEQFPDAG